MRPRVADDRGASLILVMGLLIFVGLVAAATLTYAGASIRAAGVLDSRVADDYAVDGALQVAVDRVRTSDFIDGTAGRSDTACPGVSLPGQDGTGSVTVTCEPVPGSGSIAAAIAARNPRAIQATGTAARSGEVGIAHSGSSALTVAGPVSSNSSITAAPGSLVATGAVSATAGCTGTVTGSSKDCSGAAVTTPSVSQPTTGVVRRSVPSCPNNGSTITFQPGVYDDAAALTALMTSCPASTFWFPGAAGGAPYYFDFRNGEPGYPAGTHVWTINNPSVRVVAGGATAPGPPSGVSIPGSCTSPLAASANSGVRFVFGGDSRLKVTAGQVELCGPGDASGGAPPSALMGGDRDLTGEGMGASGTAGPQTAPTGSTANPVGILKMKSNTGSGSTDPIVVPIGSSASQRNRVVAWDNSAATAYLDGKLHPNGKGERGYIKFSGFEPAAATPASVIPAGATLTYAKAYVRHREPRQTNASVKDPVAFIQMTFTPARSGAPAVGPVTPATGFTPGLGTNPDATRDTYRIDTVDLLATPALQTEVTTYGFSGASVEYLVETIDDGDLRAYLDTVQIAMGWTTPGGFRKQGTLIAGANCVAAPTTAYPGSGACPLVQVTHTDGLARFHVQGSVFAPQAALDLGQDRVTAPVVSSGVVVRQFSASIGTEPGFTGPVINWPTPMSVLLRAYRCPVQACSGSGPELPAPWELAGTALVDYADPGASVKAGARAVTVRSWSIER